MTVSATPQAALVRGNPMRALWDDVASNRREIRLAALLGFLASASAVACYELAASSSGEITSISG